MTFEKVAMFTYCTVHLSKMGGPQISSTYRKPQICGLVRFADLLKMWHFAYLRFASPIFFVICGIKTSSSPQINTCFSKNALIQIVHIKKLTKSTFRTVMRQSGAPVL